MGFYLGVGYPSLTSFVDHRGLTKFCFVFSMVEGNLLVICASLPTAYKFITHVAPKLMRGSHMRSADAVRDHIVLDDIETIGRAGKIQKHRCRTDWVECSCIHIQTVIESSHDDVPDGHSNGDPELLSADTQHEGDGQGDACEVYSREQDCSSRGQLV